MNSKLLEKVFRSDQNDRRKDPASIDWGKATTRDTERRKIVEKLLKDRFVKTGRDYYLAAMIFQHGPKIIHSQKAILLSKRSMGLNYKKAHWLFAAATDRLLTKQGKKQKYGTQFFKKINSQKWHLRPVDPKTTDKERIQFGVPPLYKIKEELKQRNKK